MTSQTVTAVQYLDPRTLLVDGNIRHAAKVDPAFIASIRDNGVLQPVITVRTPDGQLRVRFGHRRTLAAIEAGLDTLPVVVAADETTDQKGEIDRLVTQWAENEHRARLSIPERIGVIEQLAAFGVTPTQISKRTRTKRAEVDAALSVVGSDLAKAAVSRYDFLDLVQAAAVAEFESDTEAVKALVAAAKTGRFDHVAQQLRDRRDEQARLDTYAAELDAAGLTVLQRADIHHDHTEYVQHLLDQAGHRINDDEHTSCPGHAVIVREDVDYFPPGQVPAGWTVEPDGDDPDDEDTGANDGGAAEVLARGLTTDVVCQNYRAHGHHTRWGTSGGRTDPGEMTDAQREAKRAERRDTIDSNKAWRSAEPVRRTFVSNLLTRKIPPKGTIGYIAREIAEGGHELRTAMERGHEQARTFLGLPADDQPMWGYHAGAAKIVGLLGEASDARAQIVILAVVLGAQEAATDVHSWRRVNPATQRYLTFLAAHGYTLADVERRACGLPISPDEPEPGEPATQPDGERDSD